jgi:hypothetical protein
MRKGYPRPPAAIVTPAGESRRGGSRRIDVIEVIEAIARMRLPARSTPTEAPHAPPYAVGIPG